MEIPPVTLAGFLRAPGPAYQRLKKEGASHAVRFLCPVLIFFSLMTVVMTLTGNTSWPSFLEPAPEGITGVSLAALAEFSLAFLSGLILVVITGCWLHMWVYAIGDRRGLSDTVRMVFYGSSPAFLIGWIPYYVGAILGAIIAIIFYYYGIREFFAMDLLKSSIIILFFTVLSMFSIGILFVTGPFFLAFYLLILIASAGFSIHRLKRIRGT
jgi:hypothetical protein